ncbi:MAG: hypothetical protein ACI4K7_06580 [Oscillospiraceae bacterium]
MKNETEQYVSNNEYTAEFRRKTVKAALIVTGATVAVAIILIILSLKTNFLYHTDIFKVKAQDTVPIHAERNTYCGNEYEFELINYTNDDGNISVLLEATAGEAALNRISSDNFKLICYDGNGDKREEVITPIYSKEDVTNIGSEMQCCRYELTFARYTDSVNTSDDIYCLRISTESSDGIISILCNYNINS